MIALHPDDSFLSSQRTLNALLAAHFATLVGLAAAIWFELPSVVSSGFLVVALILALLAAICTGRTVARSQESIPFRERSSLSGRDAGVLALVVLASLA